VRIVKLCAADPRGRLAAAQFAHGGAQKRLVQARES
jgi:hypothetical protein